MMSINRTAMENLNYDFVLILKKNFELKAHANPQYSMRAFARDLGISVSSLSGIFKHKKGLSEDMANKICDKLDIKNKDKELFIVDVKSKHERKKRIRRTNKEKLIELEKQHCLKSEQELANSWYHFAILELVEIKSCQHDIKWFAKKLNLHSSVIENAIERMMKLGWLEIQDKQYKVKYSLTNSTSDIPSDSIKKYHSELLKKAECVLYLDEVNKREFVNMTLAFDEEKINEAKEEIRKFQETFAEKFYHQTENKNSVFQLSVQLFRLDQPEENVHEKLQ